MVNYFWKNGRDDIELTTKENIQEAMAENQLSTCIVQDHSHIFFVRLKKGKTKIISKTIANMSKKNLKQLARLI